MKQLILKNYYLTEEPTKAQQKEFTDLKVKWLAGEITEEEVKVKVAEFGLTFKGGVAEETFDEIIEFYKKNDTESLQNWLVRQMLHGPASRARTRFKKLLDDRAGEIQEEYVRIREDNTKKNKKGEMLYNAVKKDKDGKEVKKNGESVMEQTTDKKRAVTHVIEDHEKFNDAITEYINDDFKIDITPERADTIYGVRDVILDTKEQFMGKMADRYEGWCACFEGIKEVKK